MALMLLLFCTCIYFSNVVHCQNGKDLVHTPDEYLYKDVTDLDINIDLLQSIVFHVRACNDAHVGLFKSLPSPKINRFYEIVIGGWGNTKSVIRDRRQGKALVQHDGNLLNCNVYRQFWISWQGQMLKVGQGKEINKRILMEHPMRLYFDVQYVAITTGYGSEGRWLFQTGNFDCMNISCDSNQFRPNVCPVENAVTIRSVTLVERRSRSECELGESFGITGNGSIFVDNGCRATFEVCFLVFTEEETVTPSGSTVDKEEITTTQIDPQDPSSVPQVATVEQDKKTIISVVVVVVVVLIILVVVVVIVSRYRHNRNQKLMKGNFKPETEGYDVINSGKDKHSYLPLAISGHGSSKRPENEMENMEIYDEIEIRKSKVFSFGQLKNPFWKNSGVKNKLKTGSVVKPKLRFSIYDQDEYAVVK